MKKKILFLLLSLMSLFVSCSGTKEVPNEPEREFTFIGSKWEATYRFDPNDPNSALVHVTFDFSSPREVIFSYKEVKGIITPEDRYLLETQKFSYTYTQSVLKILSQDKTVKTIYKVDEKGGTMSIVGNETLNDDGEWVPSEDNDSTIFHLKKNR